MLIRKVLQGAMDAVGAPRSSRSVGRQDFNELIQQAGTLAVRIKSSESVGLPKSEKVRRCGLCRT